MYQSNVFIEKCFSIKEWVWHMSSRSNTSSSSKTLLLLLTETFNYKVITENKSKTFLNMGKETFGDPSLTILRTLFKILLMHCFQIMGVPQTWKSNSKKFKKNVHPLICLSIEFQQEKPFFVNHRKIMMKKKYMFTFI